MTYKKQEPINQKNASNVEDAPTSVQPAKTSWKLSLSFKRLLILLFFIGSLYMTEAGPCGSGMVARYNGGYGTFDMNSYNIETVQTVLAKMQPQGFALYRGYYAWDYIFTVVFAMLQSMLLCMVYEIKHGKLPIAGQLFATTFKAKKATIERAGAIILLAIPTIRGLADAIENTLLLRVLSQYPDISEKTVTIASAVTRIKLKMIGVYVIVLLCGILYKIVGKICSKISRSDRRTIRNSTRLAESVPDGRKVKDAKQMSLSDTNRKYLYRRRN